MFNLTTKIEEFGAENRAKDQEISSLAAKAGELEAENIHLKDYAAADARLDALALESHFNDELIEQLRLELQTKDAEAKHKQAWLEQNVCWQRSLLTM